MKPYVPVSITNEKDLKQGQIVVLSYVLNRLELFAQVDCIDHKTAYFTSIAGDHLQRISLNNLFDICDVYLIKDVEEV